MSLLEPADVKMSKGKKENVMCLLQSLKHSVLQTKCVYTYRESDFVVVNVTSNGV